MVVGAVAVAAHSPVTSVSVGVSGSSTSSTVTIAVFEAVLPTPSITESVTVLFPTLEQSNSVISNSNNRFSTTVILSVEPLSIWPVVILAVSFSSNCTVIFWVITVGGVVSLHASETSISELHPESLVEIVTVPAGVSK